MTTCCIPEIGLSRPIKRRKRWSVDEVEKLRGLADEYNAREIGKKLGRTAIAVEVKLKKLKVSKRSRSGWFTEQEVCEILGVDHKWLKSRDIDMYFHDNEKPPRKGKSVPWHISEKAIKAFIRKYAEELIGKKIDIVMVVDILAGIDTGHYEEG